MGGKLQIDSVLDQGYTDLSADADGRIRTRLRNPANGLGMGRELFAGMRRSALTAEEGACSWL